MLLRDGHRWYRIRGQGELWVGRCRSADLVLHDPTLSRDAVWKLRGKRLGFSISNAEGKPQRVFWKPQRLGAESWIMADPWRKDLIRLMILLVVCVAFDVGWQHMGHSVADDSDPVAQANSASLIDTPVPQKAADQGCRDQQFEAQRRRAMHLAILNPPQSGCSL